MIHYICTGTCKGVSDSPKKCGAGSCTLFDHDLKECNCTDGKHYGKQDAHVEKAEAK